MLLLGATKDYSLAEELVFSFSLLIFFSLVALLQKLLLLKTPFKHRGHFVLTCNIFLDKRRSLVVVLDVLCQLGTLRGSSLPADLKLYERLNIPQGRMACPSVSENSNRPQSPLRDRTLGLFSAVFSPFAFLNCWTVKKVTVNLKGRAAFTRLYL